MADIALSQGVRQNLLSMQKTVDLMSRTQNRLATGKRVNSALDNPTNFFVAAGLDNRSNDLSRILDSMALGIKTLEAADNGIKAMKRLIETAQGTARQALQAAPTTAVVRSSQSYTLAQSIVPTPYEAGDSITVAVGAVGPVSFTLAASPGSIANPNTVGQLIDAINGNTTLNPTGAPRVRASLDDGGKLRIEAINGQDLTIGITNGAAPAVTTDTLDELFGTGVTAAEVTAGSAARTGTFNESRSSLAQQFESLKSQIDQLIKDTSYNGVNLLNGDTLKVLFNENNTTQITIEGVIFNSPGLGLAAVINGASADSLNKWQSDYEIGEALKKLDAALTKVRTQASNFGSNLIVLQTRQDFTKQAMLTLNAGADLLTLAETNEEGANLLALQTRQQLSTQALSLASQTDQAVLRLFG